MNVYYCWSCFEIFKHFYETYPGQDEENAVSRAASKCKTLSASFVGSRNFTEEQKSVLVKLVRYLKSVLERKFFSDKIKFIFFLLSATKFLIKGPMCEAFKALRKSQATKNGRTYLQKKNWSFFKTLTPLLSGKLLKNGSWEGKNNIDWCPGSPIC